MAMELWLPVPGCQLPERPHSAIRNPQFQLLGRRDSSNCTLWAFAASAFADCEWRMAYLLVADGYLLLPTDRFHDVQSHLAIRPVHVAMRHKAHQLAIHGASQYVLLA